MGGVIVISGPVGAGKTTVTRQLLALWPGDTVAYIEGDEFGSFIARSEGRDRRANFSVIMRAMTAAALPFARAGFDVLLDFSMPPEFLSVASKILKEVPLDYVVLWPSAAVCAARCAARDEGAIPDYSKYEEFHALFAKAGAAIVKDKGASASLLAARIRTGLLGGKVSRCPVFAGSEA